MPSNNSRLKNFPWVAIAITISLTLLIAGGGAYFFGLLSFDGGKGDEAKGKNTGKDDREIAYWRAPMNPTEIYDKPGKSAMGMDLVPVYKNELESEKRGGESGRKIAYWRAPMNPTEIYDEPGKSAMGMDLVPVYEDELVGGVEISIDPVVEQNMGLRTAAVKRSPLTRSIRTYGHVTPDETRTVQITMKIDGWIENLHVDFTGKFVKKGDPLFEIYSPDLLAAQEEFLGALRNSTQRNGRTSEYLLESARRRLRYFDIQESEIESIIKTGEVKKTLLIRSPFTGHVIRRNVEEGSFVKAGTNLFHIADLSMVWVEAHIYEYELPWISKGMPAVMTLPYLPGEVFKGKVSYIYPYLQPKTRDIVIRLEFENTFLELKPDMYADIRIKADFDVEGVDRKSVV